MTWPMVQFQELYSESSRNGVYKPKEFHGTGVKMVKMGELFGYDIINTQEMNRLSMTDVEMFKSGLQDGDLLFGRRSLVESGAGKCSLVEGLDEPMTFESSIIRVRVDQNKVRPRFLLYWLKSHQGRGNIKAIVTGTNVKGIKASALSKINIAKPPIDVQDKIVGFLRAYDDLIENNKHRIELLEKVPQLLYKEWFVNLHFPGHEHTRIVDGVPDGWEEVSFSNIATFMNGYAFKPADLGSVGYPIVKIPELRNGPTLKTPRNTGETIPNKYVISNGDLLFSWSGTLLVNIWNHGPALLNQHLFKVTPNYPDLRSFVFLALKNSLSSFYNQTTGATMKHIRKGALESVTIPLPSPLLLRQFEDFVSDILQQISILEQQITKLKEARDLLLPKLMSGEISV